MSTMGLDPVDMHGHAYAPGNVRWPGGQGAPMVISNISCDTNREPSIMAVALTTTD